MHPIMTAIPRRLDLKPHPFTIKNCQIIPQDITGMSPAELMFCCRLDLLLQDLKAQIATKQEVIQARCDIQ